MKKFLVLYKSPTSARAQMANATPEQANAGMDAWMNWSKTNGKAITDPGSPLGDTTAIESGKTGKGDDTIGGYSIMQADSADDLIRALAEHPHFKMGPSASIEVHEVLSMPGM